MKILRIIARLNIGGPARNAVLLTERFSTSSVYDGLRSNSIGMGYETVLVCGEVGEGEGDMGFLAREKGIEPVIVPELGRELSFVNDWRAFWKIYRIICQEKPDIIHTHTAKAGALGRLAGIMYRLLRRSPWRIFRNGMMDSRLPSGKAAGFRGNDSAVILVHTFHGHVLHSYFGKVKTFIFLWIERILALFTDRIITVSESLKKELVEKFRIAPEKKFSVVELGFDLNELLKLPVREKSDCVNIGIVGRLATVKNHKMLFRAVSYLNEKMGQPHKAGAVPIFCPKFIIIGDGELRRDLEAYVKKLGIADIVEFRGWVKDLRKIYEEMDIMVLTSLNEGTPVSIIEAMAAARPVVATDVGGVRDIVRDGESGYLVDSNDDGIFAERLTDLINNSNKRKTFGKYGRELVRDRFSKDRLIKDMKKVYSENFFERK